MKTRAETKQASQGIELLATVGWLDQEAHHDRPGRRATEDAEQWKHFVATRAGLGLEDENSRPNRGSNMRESSSSLSSVLLLVLSLFLSLSCAGVDGRPAEEDGPSDLDTRVRQFLESHRWGWGNMNVPEVDGQTLHDIVLENGYTRALEIGTSTGHSSIWIAWALSKTGGRLITIDIDAERRSEALQNFEQAGLSEFIDSRLGDAHELLPALEGPFDFVFSDADKGWYKNYLIALLPKLQVGGCYTTHNVSRSGWFRRGGGDYLDYLLSLSNLETTVDDRGGGLAISYKQSE